LTTSTELSQRTKRRVVALFGEAADDKKISVSDKYLIFRYRKRRNRVAAFDEKEFFALAK
jgi:hypothetical protein